MLISEVKPIQNNNPGEIFINRGHGSYGAFVKDRKFLKLIIEEPCLKSCEYLYDCNIRTIDSTANKNNIIYGRGHIGIDYDTLDEANKKVYEKLVSIGLVSQKGENTNGFTYSNQFDVPVHISDTTTVEEFSEKMFAIVKQFKPQDILYGRYDEAKMKITITNMLNCYAADEESDMYYSIASAIIKKLESSNFKGGPKENVFLELYDDETGQSKYISYDDIKKLFIEELHLYYDATENIYWLDELLYKKHLEYKLDCQMKKLIIDANEKFKAIFKDTNYKNKIKKLTEDYSIYLYTQKKKGHLTIDNVENYRLDSAFFENNQNNYETFSVSTPSDKKSRK